MTKTLVKFLSLTIITLSILTTSCKKKETSGTTGWNYNDKKWGGFEKLNYEGQATGPNLVLIEGGTFNMGLSDQDVTFEWNNVPRRVTVSSFYMDQTEVANIDYREYLYWLENHYGTSFPEVARPLHQLPQHKAGRPKSPLPNTRPGYESNRQRASRQ